MFNCIYEELGMINTYDVWYITPKRNLKKRKSFSTMKELTKWCKINYKNVRITGASSQVFKIIDGLKGINHIDEKQEDYVWRFGKNGESKQ